MNEGKEKEGKEKGGEGSGEGESIDSTHRASQAGVALSLQTGGSSGTRCSIAPAASPGEQRGSGKCC